MSKSKRIPELVPATSANGDEATKEADAIDPEEAKAAIAADKELRGKACMAEVEAACKKYRCRLVPSMTIVGGQIENHVVGLAVGE